MTQLSASNNAIIRVDQVSKRFRFWKNRPNSVKTVLVDLLRGKTNLGTRTYFDALIDVSFEIGPGEFVGIMGRNGAGKSTLLKLITGIYVPTAGTIEVKGQIAPLIELGAGFHPDLSGYENIFLNASILGHGKAATEAAIPKILEFAELGDKIDMPIKNYSSGMLVRLGFAIACQLDTPITLIDEVLAVGDIGFQKKCLRRIHEMHAAGRTIVLVTHDPDAVRDNCSRCIVIDKNRKIFDGPASAGVDAYIQAMG